MSGDPNYPQIEWIRLPIEDVSSQPTMESPPAWEEIFKVFQGLQKGPGNTIELYLQYRGEDEDTRNEHLIQWLEYIVEYFDDIYKSEYRYVLTNLLGDAWRYSRSRFDTENHRERYAQVREKLEDRKQTLLEKIRLYHQNSVAKAIATPPQVPQVKLNSSLAEKIQLLRDNAPSHVQIPDRVRAKTKLLKLQGAKDPESVRQEEQFSHRASLQKCLQNAVNAYKIQNLVIPVLRLIQDYEADRINPEVESEVWIYINEALTWFESNRIPCGNPQEALAYSILCDINSRIQKRITEASVSSTSNPSLWTLFKQLWLNKE